MKKLAILIALVILGGAFFYAQTSKEAADPVEDVEEAMEEVMEEAMEEVEEAMEEGEDSSEEGESEAGEAMEGESMAATKGTSSEGENTEEVMEEAIAELDYAVTSGSSSYSVQKEFFGKPTETIVGTSSGVSGSLNLLDDKLSIDVTVKNDFSSGNGSRDGEVKQWLGGDISVKASELTLNDGFFVSQGTASLPLQLTINGITKTVQFSVTGAITDPVITASGSATINMNDFNVTPPSILNVYSVAPETLLSFEVEAK